MNIGLPTCMLTYSDIAHVAIEPRTPLDRRMEFVVRSFSTPRHVAKRPTNFASDSVSRQHSVAARKVMHTKIPTVNYVTYARCVCVWVCSDSPLRIARVDDATPSGCHSIAHDYVTLTRVARSIEVRFMFLADEFDVYNKAVHKYASAKKNVSYFKNATVV